MLEINLRTGACMCVTVIALLAAAVLPLAGCDQKNEREKVIDIEAPGVDIEVEKSNEDGSVNVDVKPGD
jgi:hypothetical protein